LSLSLNVTEKIKLQCSYGQNWDVQLKEGMDVDSTTRYDNNTSNLTTETTFRKFKKGDNFKIKNDNTLRLNLMFRL
jgi:hypothetical protein